MERCGVHPSRYAAYCFECRTDTPARAVPPKPPEQSPQSPAVPESAPVTTEPAPAVREWAQQTFALPSPSEAELLAVLTEESSEVAKAAMKCLRHGFNDTNPVKPEEGTNLDRLHEELGDLMNAIGLLMDAGVLNNLRIAELAKAKRVTVGLWLHHPVPGVRKRG